MSTVTSEMKRAGALFKSAYGEWDDRLAKGEPFDSSGVPNADLILAVLEGKVAYEEGLYTAMERARPYKPPTIADAMVAMAGSVNGMSGSVEKSREAVSNVFSAEHRTLQQLIFSVYVVPIVRTLAKMGHQGWTDARNRRSAEIAMQMDVVLERVARENGGEIHLPFI